MLGVLVLNIPLGTVLTISFYNCSGEIAGVICYEVPVNNISLSYNGKSSSLEGNVFLQGKPICDDLWDRTDATVACKMLGSSGSASASTRSTYGKVPLNFKIGNNFKCTGSEQSLWDCPSKEWECLHRQPSSVAILCCHPLLLTRWMESGYRVQLRGGAFVTSGDAFINGQPINYVGWDVKDAKVACKMLNFSGTKSATTRSSYARYTYFKMYWR